MNEERQASLLAQWLDGEAPPEGLDADVVEAIHVLRPELAPAPRVTVDDILAGVTSGPLSLPAARAEDAPTEEIHDEQSGRHAPPAEVVDLAAVRRSRRRIWAGVGTLAAAALVLVTFLPTADEAPGLDHAAVPEAPTLEAELQQKKTQEMVNPSADLSDNARPEKARSDEQGAAQAKAEDDAEVWESMPMGKSDGPAELIAQDGAGAGSSYGPPPVAAAPSPAAEPELAEDEELDVVMDFEEAEPQALYEPAAASRSSSGGVSKTESAGSRERKDRLARRPSSGADNTMSAPVQEEAAELDDWDEGDIASTPPPLPTDLDGLRAVAAPGDYNPSWYLGQLDAAGQERFKATLDQAAGQSASAAANTCAALIGDPNPRVGQDMAGRAAVYAMSVGELDKARDLVRRGQRQSSANTVFRARLFYLEGQILERQGDVEGAKAAYRTAAILNQAR